MDRLAVLEARVVRFGDRAPVAALAVDRDHVVGVVVRLEIHDQRLMADRAQGGGTEDRALEAMRRLLTQHPLRRPGARREVVRHLVDEPLDAIRRLQ